MLKNCLTYLYCPEIYRWFTGKCVITAIDHDYPPYHTSYNLLFLAVSGNEHTEKMKTGMTFTIGMLLCFLKI